MVLPCVDRIAANNMQARVGRGCTRLLALPHSCMMPLDPESSSLSPTVPPLHAACSIEHDREMHTSDGTKHSARRRRMEREWRERRASGGTSPWCCRTMLPLHFLCVSHTKKGSSHHGFHFTFVPLALFAERVKVLDACFIRVAPRSCGGEDHAGEPLCRGSSSASTCSRSRHGEAS